MIQAGGEPVAELELAPQQVDPGGVVLDAHGRVLGLLRLGPVGQAIVQPLPGPTAVPVSSGRGWLGVSLQPTTVPDAVADRVGQQTGRLVVSLTAGGPAELGGLRLGDVLLTVNDVGLSGPHALRDALKAETIGSTITVGVLRDGGLMSIHLVVATRPH
jgi:S1-C subfamily serine protease